MNISTLKLTVKHKANNSSSCFTYAIVLCFSTNILERAKIATWSRYILNNFVVFKVYSMSLSSKG